MKKILGFILQILSILCLMRLISNQMNTNLQKIQDDFRNKARGFNYRMEWFKPDRMSNFAKLFLCVDIFQKQMNVILTGGLYQVNTSNQELPNFKGKLLKIKNTDVLYPTVLKHVMHCPLNLITFEKLNYMQGTEFYITESPNEYCVYSLYPEYQPLETEPILHITAEICGLFLNIRYDKLKLEQEYEKHLIRKGIDLLSWPYLDQISNEEKFVLCLNVYEKLTYQTYFRVPYLKNNSNNDLPTCNLVANHFIFTTYKGQHPKGFIATLHCPMSNILFLNRDKSMPSLPKTIAPFYLAQSVNPNCVYKLGINGKTVESKMNLNLSHEVFIQGEICSIRGTVNQNIAQIESKMLSVLSIQRADIESGGEILLMDPTHQSQLCGDVYSAIYNTDYLYNDTLFRRPTLRKTRLVVGSLKMTIKTVICNMEKSNPLSAMPLAYSPNIGCVYKLDSNEILQKGVFNVTIKYEVCDVYPARYLLQIKRAIIEPIL